MPRYYFHIHDSVSQIDTDGIELPDWHAARSEAIRFAGEIFRNEADQVSRHKDWRIEVADHTGLILFQMTIQIIESPFVQYG